MFKLLLLSLLFSCAQKTASGVGGWYPVFFKKADSKSLHDILNKLNQGSCANITYPTNNLRLANEVSDFFQQNGFILKMRKSDCHDDANQQCDHETVVVTVWTKTDSNICQMKKNNK